MRPIYVVTVLAGFMILSSGLVKEEMMSFGTICQSDGLQALQEQATLVAEETEKKMEPAPSEDVQERAIRPSFGVVPPTTVKPPSPSVVAPLTASECTSLGGVVDASNANCTKAGQFTCSTSTGSACVNK